MKIDLSSVVTEAENAPDTGEYKPEQDAVLRVSVVDVRVSEATDGKLRINQWLEVEEGDDAGRRFWFFQKFGDYAGLNKIFLNNLDAQGLSPETLSNVSDSDEIVDVLLNSQAMVKVGWRANKNGGDDWPNHRFSPIASAEGDESGDDDDLMA